MTLTVQVYSSTDVGAPALSGVAGALVTLLDAVLVDGYGTGPSAKAPAGWTRAFTASNKRAFRNSPVSGSGYHLRVDDTAAIGNARHVHVRAYSTMSDVDTGADPTPTVALVANGPLWVKSSLLSGTSRPWMIIATEKWFYLFVDYNGTGIDQCTPYFAGDILSYMAIDGHNFVVSGSNVTTYTGATGNQLTSAFMFGATIDAAPSIAGGHYIGRAYTGLSGSKLIDIPRNVTGQSNAVGSAGFSYPEPISGGLVWEYVLMHEGIMQIRGRMPNVIVPLHPLPFTDLSSQSAVDGFPGVTFLVKINRARGISSSLAGTCLFDLTTPAA